MHAGTIRSKLTLEGAKVHCCLEIDLYDTSKLQLFISPPIQSIMSKTTTNKTASTVNFQQYATQSNKIKFEFKMMKLCTLDEGLD